MGKSIFITGIDTNTGKTIATGLLCAYLNKIGIKSITQKIVQTGDTGISSDILLHRKLCGVSVCVEDKIGLTSPYVFKFASSPHLAAKIEEKEIEPKKIYNFAAELEKKYDVLLIEGAGGLMVPIKSNYFIKDYILEYKYPVILVTSAKLGSINHTLLTLESLQESGIRIAGIVYNTFLSTSDIITESTLDFFLDYAINKLDRVPIVELPFVDIENPKPIDFKSFFDFIFDKILLFNKLEKHKICNF